MGELKCRCCPDMGYITIQFSQAVVHSAPERCGSYQQLALQWTTTSLSWCTQCKRRKHNIFSRENSYLFVAFFLLQADLVLGILYMKYSAGLVLGMVVQQVNLSLSLSLLMAPSLDVLSNFMQTYVLNGPPITGLSTVNQQFLNVNVSLFSSMKLPPAYLQ
eukprot:TRINITY_DN11044_c0_g1_i9.p1 TRINITY_DN11044_c0_g1~~TRINITY_DN11044_c0_g1_i9.p1  ORF type:complete len:161 (+),score=4.75 TRINITY_DN11044_c0_g1_i9:202-684(+)